MLFAAALLRAQTSDRDRTAIQDAEQTWVKAAQATGDQRLAWWREARFGCFMHWGVYFKVWVKYSTGSVSIHERFGQKLEAEIEPTAKDTAPRDVKLGAVKAPAGVAAVRVIPVGIDGAELIRLFSVTLQPLSR